MASFLMMLALAPLMWGLTWIHASPMRRLDRYFWLKFIVHVVFSVIIIGGLLAQMNFLGHREAGHTRQFYLLAFLIIEAVPAMAIIFYRYYQDPSSYWSGWKR